MKLGKNQFIFFYMLQNIKGPDCIELIIEGNIAGIHLHEIR